MTNESTVKAPRGALLWTGRVVTLLTVLFLAFDSGAKIVEAGPAVRGSIQLGFPASATVGIGGLLALLVLLYVVPRTAVAGAVLLTGYFGGAVAIHLRAGNGAFPIAFTLAFGGLVWAGLALRRPEVARLLSGRP